MSGVIPFGTFAMCELRGYLAHVVKLEVDGLPSVGIRILFSNEEQRADFLTGCVLDDPDLFEIPDLGAVDE